MIAPGGGPGMIMGCDAIFKIVEELKTDHPAK